VRDIFLGVVASMFFAVTFILNRSMELSGGSWMWSSSLRFLFMLPFFFLIVLCRKNLQQVVKNIREQPFQWGIWSFVGFGLFYAPLTFAASYGPGWLIAGSWQLTIVAGTLLGPFFYKTIQTSQGEIKVRNQLEVRSLLISLIIIIGVGFIHFPNVSSMSVTTMILGLVPVIIAAIAYPLGNRKMMEVCNGKIDTFQRILGMTLMSLPFWLILCLIAYLHVGLPSSQQVLQCFIVGVSSGVIATTLFFLATDRTKDYQGKLAAVEATQSLQVVFVIIGETVLLSAPLPTGLTMLGLFLIMLGMILHSYFTKPKKGKGENITQSAS